MLKVVVVDSVEMVFLKVTLLRKLLLAVGFEFLLLELAIGSLVPISSELNSCSTNFQR